jgi:hypothetical protein
VVVIAILLFLAYHKHTAIPIPSSPTSQYLSGAGVGGGGWRRCGSSFYPKIGFTYLAHSVTSSFVKYNAFNIVFG